MNYPHNATLPMGASGSLNSTFSMSKRHSAAGISRSVGASKRVTRIGRDRKEAHIGTAPAGMPKRGILAAAHRAWSTLPQDIAGVSPHRDTGTVQASGA